MIAGSFYTYVHLRADDGRVFYVGKGSGQRAHSSRSRNPFWHRTVQKHGLRVELAATWPTETAAFEHERFLISCFRELGHPLSNLTDGGDGPSGFKHSAETRAQLSRMQIGKTLTEEHKRKVGAASLGHKLSEEAKRAISEKNKGRKHTEETRRKNSEARKGKPLPREQVEKIAAANRGRKRTEETRRKIAEKALGRTGRRHSEETKAKMSAAHKQRAPHPNSIAALRAAKPEARRAAQAQKEA